MNKKWEKGRKRERKERKGEKRGEKEIEKREKRERKERNIERKGEKGEKEMFRVNYHQSAFNSQKEKLNILAEMLEISKSGLPADLYIYNRSLSV